MRSANGWPAGDTRSLTRFYGPVGMHQVRLPCAYPLRLAWDNSTSVTHITVHERVAESMDRAMRQILAFYGYPLLHELNIDQWGGCLSVRKKRGNTRAWSVHAWGAANDWWPQQNRLRAPFSRAAFSDPVYTGFFNAWIIEGWHPLGLSWGRDAMHIEAVDNAVPLLETPDDFVYHGL